MSAAACCSGEGEGGEGKEGKKRKWRRGWLGKVGGNWSSRRLSMKRIEEKVEEGKKVEEEKMKFEVEEREG